MPKKLEMHVISNTHWDREWSVNFQETRMRLIEFLDDLLDLFDKRPDYKSFLLDSQTVPLEDYLEARPENRERIGQAVSTGRLMVGPWYTCPEEFSVNGESLVRNLFYGHKIAKSFGKVMKVGYSPFSYGQVSQMPQIYMGFGIDSILFYHGVTHDEVSNEYWFEGADGTRILASQISAQARYNFYHAVYRPAVHKMENDARVYDWQDGGLPFHICSEDQPYEQYYLLDPPRYFNSRKIKPAVLALREIEKQNASTPFLAFMMGHDASVGDESVLKIIESAKRYLGRDVILHGSLPELMEKVKSAVKDLPVLKGERRTPKVRTGRIHLYSDVISGRSRVKRLNAQMEELLQRRVEPFAALAWTLGADYPDVLLDYAWKEMLKGHAHDSIAGSGVEDIELDMRYRLRQVSNISRGIIRRSLGHIQRRIDHSSVNPTDVLVTAFNASPHARSEVLSAVMDIPPHVASREFDLIDVTSGKPIPVQIATRKPNHVVVHHAKNANHTMNCEQVRYHFDASSIPAMGYSSFRLNPKGTFAKGGLVCGQNCMENEFLHVKIQSDGTLRVTHKPSGVVYDGLHYFEDSGEAGQAWMHVEPGIDRMVTSLGCPVAVALEESGPLFVRYRVDYSMTIPVGLDNAGSNAWERIDGFDNAARRTEETCAFFITSYFTLRKGAKSIEVKTCFDNNAEMHRLRVLFPTMLSEAKYCYAEGAYDVVQRPVIPEPDSPWHGIGPRTYPMQRFIDIHDGKNGLAVINDGLREYEVTQDNERTIAVTLLRCVETAICSSSAGWEIHPDMKLSQCPGEHTFCYSIFPHAGSWDQADMYREVDRLCTPIEVAQAGQHAGDLPPSKGFMELTPTNLTLTACKRADDGRGIVVRFFNPTEKQIRGVLKFANKIESAELVSLEELPVRTLKPASGALKIQCKSREIVTVRVQFAETT